MIYSKVIPWVGYTPSHKGYVNAICDSEDGFSVRTDLTNTTLALDSLHGTPPSPLIIDANAGYEDGRSTTYAYALDYLTQLRESRGNKGCPVVVFSPESLFEYHQFEFFMASSSCEFIDGGLFGSQNLVNILRSYYADGSK